MGRDQSCATAAPARISRQTGVLGTEAQAQRSRLVTDTLAFRALSSRRERPRGKGRPRPSRGQACSWEVG